MQRDKRVSLLAQGGTPSRWCWALLALDLLLVACGGRIDEAFMQSDLESAPSAAGGAPAVLPDQTSASDAEDELSPSDPDSSLVENKQDASSYGLGGSACVELNPAPPVKTDLELRFSCGIHRADIKEYSKPVSVGQVCETSFGELNTFALEVAGPGSDRYEAVARCGYIRYDNGTFVGERVLVEARDGTWCHELALEHIELMDRMLLTDVSFALEPVSGDVAKAPLALEIAGYHGQKAHVRAEGSVCLYSAYRTYGAATCQEARSTETCFCPCDAVGFLRNATITLVEDGPP